MHSHKKIDYFFLICLSIVVFFYILAWQGLNLGIQNAKLQLFSGSVFALINQIWWGILLGLIMLILLSFIPRQCVISLFGKEDNTKSLIRAAIAGIFLDLCSHGILMIAAKLYERGVSIGQIMTFLIASPWNSFSLTVILIALIGLKWTIFIILLSVIIALITGRIFIYLENNNKIPTNPNRIITDNKVNFTADIKQNIKKQCGDRKSWMRIVGHSLQESQMVIRWLLFGVLVASLIKAFIETHIMQTYFGPSILGLIFTLLAATIIEVCSEGSAPIAADLFTRANAPGNGFAFLMTGVSTDYTEIMVIKDMTKSWKIAFLLPLISLPQIIVFAIILNSTRI